MTGPTFEDDRIRALRDELDNFEEIARSLKPSPGEVPRLPGVDIAGVSVPLRGGIGGDHVVYIDFDRRFNLDARIAAAEADGRHAVAEKLRLNKRRAGILLADAAGHRVTDALICAMLHQAFLLGTYYEMDLYGEITTRLFEHLNTRFYQSSSFNKFLTMVYGEIAETGTFRFISAGHPAPIVFSHEFGRTVTLGADRTVASMPIGVLPSEADADLARVSGPRFKSRYSVNEIALLGAGDLLLLATDGLVEHAEGRFFPAELERLLVRVHREPAAAICAHVIEDLRAFAPPEDDVSLVVVKKT